MSEPTPNKTSYLLTVIGVIGSFLIFAILLFVAYLPNRPERADQAAVEKRQRLADEARALSASKIDGYKVVDADSGRVQVPIDAAMALTLNAYANDNRSVWQNRKDDAVEDVAQ